MKVTKQFKIGIISILAIGVIVGLYIFNDYLSKEKRWFYATATDIKAIDKVYWGMSKEEVERAVGEKLTVESSDYLFTNKSTNAKGFKLFPIKKEFQLYSFKGINIDFYGLEKINYKLFFYKARLYKIYIQNLDTDNLTEKDLNIFTDNLISDLNSKFGKYNYTKTNEKRIFISKEIHWGSNTKIGARLITYKPKDGVTLHTNFEFELVYHLTRNQLLNDIKNYKSNLF